MDGVRIVNPSFQLTSVVERAAQCLREDSDSDSDGEADTFLPPPTPPPKSKRSLASPSRADALSFRPATPTPSSEPRPTAKSSQKRSTAANAREAADGAQAVAGPKAISVQRATESETLSSEFDWLGQGVPVASTGWMGLQDQHIRPPSPAPPLPEPRQYTMQELMEGHQFELYDWNGHDCINIEAVGGVNLVLLGGRPRDATWDADVAEAAATKMAETGEPSLAADEDLDLGTRRGDHYAETVGVGMGGGRVQPTAFDHDEAARAALDELICSESFQRIVGFTNSLFQTHAPDLHEYYRHTMDAIYGWASRQRPSIQLPFFFGHNAAQSLLRSVFGSFVFNFGPRTATLPHIDFANLAWGWCFITALGNFDPDHGGHLVLWDLKMIIRFPAGSTIAIPSALLRHFEHPPSGLFRFVGNKFKTEKRARRSRLSTGARQAEIRERRARYARGLEMLRRKQETDELPRQM
ncbi:hypothetical protein MKEN_00882000 [Mycena kentingensis (nom. inval.)]|nr:hypothetical protein MKEN_00882000 [Mycena kentingensis (nom. inval.)]